MSPPRLAIAAGNRLGARAASNVASAGGNAVDACLASGVMAWVAEPFFASMAGSGFATIRSPDGEVEVIDGNVAMPLTLPGEPGQGTKRTYFPNYADGMYTGIGGGSVAVPGVLAAVRLAWERHGRIEWAALFEDAIEAARGGISFPRTSGYYESVTWDAVWSHYPEAFRILGREGVPLREGEHFVQNELAEALEAVAQEGTAVFYQGGIAQAMTEEIQRDGGFLTIDDLARYEAIERKPISTEAFGWSIDSNPPPAVGGAVLTHMLAILDGTQLDDPLSRLRSIVEAQRAAMGYRKERYQDPGEVASALSEALETLRGNPMQSPSTTHTSAADSDGYVCSLTESNGYGSGLVVSGILLNNTLGEEELNPLGVHGLALGSRCHSNMAPTVVGGRSGGIERHVGLGSPGADRIVGAIAQTLIRLAVDGDSLEDAVAAPRAHLDPRPNGDTLCYEPGLPGEELGFITRPYDDIHMYFGGVQAASVDEYGTVDAAHDPRRSGGSALVPAE